MPNDENILDSEEIDKEVKKIVDEVFGNYQEFSKALSADILDARDLLRTDEKNQFYRRSYIRTFFSFAEGVLYAKRLIINRYIKNNDHSLLGSRLSSQEIALLSDDGFDIKKNGDVKVTTGKNRQPFLNYLRFIVRMNEKYFQVDNKIDFDDEGWYSFQSAFKVRNRITHPKNKIHLIITDQEIRYVKKGAKWFADSIWHL